ncbi:MAG: pilus assembly protein [Frankiales bacterium]|nr:pilus assembly protein [Frankiales bacterium]
MVPVRRARRRGDGGAAAVEFALVVPVLLAVVFGIIDYGIWFNSSLNLRQGVRDGARQAAVSNFSSGSGCGTVSYVGSPSTDIRNLICSTLVAMSFPTTTSAAVRVKFIQNGVQAGFVQGNNIQVCAMAISKSLTGITPIPKSGLLTSQVTTRIETPILVNTETAGDGTRNLSSPDWSWCT